MESPKFSGLIEKVFSDNDKYSFYYDGKTLNLNLLDYNGSLVGTSFRKEYLSANFTLGGTIGLFNNYCRNNVFNHSAIIVPAQIFIPNQFGYNTKFNRLLFKGKIVNQLFPPIQKLKYDSSKEFYNFYDGSKKIELKSFEETDVRFNTLIAGENYECIFGVYLPGSITSKSNNLGELTSYFSISSKNEKEIKDILPLYNFVRKIFQFLMKQMDIYFDEIEVSLVNEDGKFEKVGYFIDNAGKESDLKITYNISSLLNNIGTLFSKICENELNYNYIAKDNTEAKYITPESYIKVCGAFEHNYAIVFKGLNNKDIFKKNTIELIANFLDNDRKTNNRSAKYVKYYDHIIEILNHDLNSVATQYCRCLKKYKKALDGYIKQLKERYPLKNENCLGSEFASFRNNDAHGGLIEFTDESVCAFLCGLVLIECMILDISGYSMSEIETIITDRYCM